MNFPSHVDETEVHPAWNQDLQALSSNHSTRADHNGLVNCEKEREKDSGRNDGASGSSRPQSADIPGPPSPAPTPTVLTLELMARESSAPAPAIRLQSPAGRCCPSRQSPSAFVIKAAVTAKMYARFVGPGFLIAVAYIDPGNYSTDIQAGAETKYRHLFVILLANLFAIFLQSLCIKLGSVTGLDLAQNCRKHLPRWATWILYFFAEAAIIATDIAEVIGSAIALNLLLNIPVVAGCAITLVDVLVLLLFYQPNGSITRVRLFEYFVMALVLGVVVCFCLQLSYIHGSTAAQVFRGYLPSSAVVEGNGIYLSCGIMGATIMPHSLFLGSGLVQPRLKQFDEQNSTRTTAEATDHEREEYVPSIYAIRACLKYSIVELAIALFTFALFVNSAILIVSGAALYPNTAATNADLFGIHDLLSSSLSDVAGTIFALALLLSGTSAGIVCTMAGQMVSEGMLNWTIKPWVRRLFTRFISIIPSIIIAAAVGKKGLNEALNASQVVLSVILPIVSTPVVWFTCRSHIMSVQVDNAEGVVNMRNGWLVSVLAIVIWLVLVVLNVALLVLVGLGKA